MDFAWSIIKGAGMAVLDFLKGFYSIGNMLYYGISADVAAVVCLVSSDPPKWTEEVLGESEEYFGNIAKAVSHPVETVEAMAQSANDTYEKEGLTYMVSYVVADIVIGKAAAGEYSKVKGANKADDVADVSKTANGIEKKTSSKAWETGGRNLDELSVDEILALDDEAAKLYEMIRNSSDDIVKISNQTGIPQWKIKNIKEHLFYNEHKLSDRVGLFDPDIEIADAWKRLMEGKYNQNDLDLLSHEYYEYKFEDFFGTDYRTAHNRTVESGRDWNPYKSS